MVTDVSRVESGARQVSEPKGVSAFTKEQRSPVPRSRGERSPFGIPETRGVLEKQRRVEDGGEHPERG